MLHALLHLAAFFPRVESPWPHSINIDFPVVTAGAGGVVGNVWIGAHTAPEQDRLTRLGLLIGFWFGVAFYGAALVNQLSSPT